jgi:hypothetical protein
MAIEKGLYAAPEGIDDLLEGEMMDDDLLKWARRSIRDRDRRS